MEVTQFGEKIIVMNSNILPMSTKTNDIGLLITEFFLTLGFIGVLYFYGPVISSSLISSKLVKDNTVFNNLP